MGSNVLNSRTPLKYSSNSVWKNQKLWRGDEEPSHHETTVNARKKKKSIKSPQNAKMRGRVDGEGRREIEMSLSKAKSQFLSCGKNRIKLGEK